MEPHIEDCIRAIEEVKADAEALVAPLEDAELNWRSGPKRWSIGQCLQHLNIFGRAAVVPKIDEMLVDVQARELRGDGRIRPGWFGRWIIGVFDAPPGRKVKTSRGFVPPSELVKDEVFEDFERLQDDLISRAEQAREFDLKAIKRRLPMPVWLNLGEWFLFGLAHERRHLWQARQVSRREGFPGATAVVSGGTAAE